MRLKFSKLEPSDGRWWSTIVERGVEISRAVESEGKGLWNLETESGETLNVERVLMVDGGTLYFVSRGLSTKLPIMTISSFSKDHDAQKKMDRLPDLVSKETYLAQWSAQGTFKLKPGWGD